MCSFSWIHAFPAHTYIVEKATPAHTYASCVIMCTDTYMRQRACMYVCIFMYVCLCVLCVFILCVGYVPRTSMHAHMFVSIYVQVCLRVFRLDLCWDLCALPKHMHDCTYAYICMHVRAHARIFVCMYVCAYVCMCVRMLACTYVGIYACMMVCMYVCMYVCLYVCMYERHVNWA